MLTSARRGISYPNPATRLDPADVPAHIALLVAALEVDVVYGQGTLATRPVSTPGSPGMQGRIYVGTDQTPMTVEYDYGTGWISIGGVAAGGVGTAQLADGAVTTPKIADANVTTIKIADANVTLAKLSASLKPSGTAIATDEALRAIGTGAGQVLAGNNPAVAGSITFSADAVANLYRSAAGTVKTDGAFYAKGTTNTLGFAYVPATAVGTVIASYVGAEANTRFNISVNGVLNWGPGGATATDVNLYRHAAAYLRTDTGFVVGTSTYLDYGNTGSKLYFGSLGDTNMYRSSAGVLATDNPMIIAGNIDRGYYFIDSGGGYGGMKRTAADGILHIKGQTNVAIEPTAGSIATCSTRLLVVGSDVQRGAYGLAFPRHIEAGSGAYTSNGSLSVTFTDAFGVAPVVVVTTSNASSLSAVTSPSTTGCTLTASSPGTGAQSGTYYWMAEALD